MTSWEQRAVDEEIAKETKGLQERGYVPSVELCPECGFRVWVLWYEGNDGRETLNHECGFCGWSDRDE